METIKLYSLIICLLFLLSLSSCSSLSDPLSYQKRDFRACISWEEQGVQFCALLTSRTDENSQKHLSLEYQKPDSLCSLTVKKDALGTSATFEGLEVSSTHAGRLIAIADLFEIDATLTKSSVEEHSGARLNLAHLVDAQGRPYTVYLYETGTPRRISAEGTVLEVISFEYTD